MSISRPEKIRRSARFGSSWDASELKHQQIKLQHPLTRCYICWDESRKHGAFTMGTSLKVVAGLDDPQNVTIRTDIDRDVAIRLACSEKFGLDPNTTHYAHAADALRLSYKNIGSGFYKDFKEAMENLPDDEKEAYFIEFISTNKFDDAKVNSIAAAVVKSQRDMALLTQRKKEEYGD